MKCPVCGNVVVETEESYSICDCCGFMIYTKNNKNKHNKGKDIDRQKKEKRENRWR